MENHVPENIEILLYCPFTCNFYVVRAQRVFCQARARARAHWLLVGWADSGLVTDQAVQAAIDESLKLAGSKQQAPLSRVVNFSLAREANRELKAK